MANYITIVRHMENYLKRMVRNGLTEKNRLADNDVRQPGSEKCTGWVQGKESMREHRPSSIFNKSIIGK